MTSSCFHYGSWMTILLCLFSGGAPKGPVGLADTHPSDLSGWSLGTWPASLGGWTSWASLGCSFFAPKMPFWGSKNGGTQEMAMHGPGQLSTQVEGWIVSASPTGPFGAPPASKGRKMGWSI